MSDTRESILMAALRLFARDGYEAVSVSMIAGELGMTKGALYKHYRNKRDIFDCIVARMYQIDAERSQQYRMPEEQYAAAPSAYRDVAWENIKQFTAAQFIFWTEDDFARNFRRMLTLEQYRNPETAQLYQNCIVSGPTVYMEDIFREMMAKGALRDGDPKQLALEFYAPLYLLIGISDGAKDREQHLTLLTRHVEQFIQYHTAPGKERNS